jgi:mono/diheme cytochrome c family protein
MTQQRGVGHFVRCVGLLAGLGVCGLALGCHRETKPAVDGSLIFASTCARCHGTNGCGGMVAGRANRSPNLCDPSFQSAFNDAQIKDMIKNGKGMMPGFDAYNDEQLAALVRFVRSLKPGAPQ